MADDPRNLQKYPPILFDEARRREFIDPDGLIKEVGIKSGNTIADFGAGAGFFSVPAARSVGAKGCVYAVDINPNNLSIIRGKAIHEKVEKRVELIEGNVETGRGLKVPDGEIDVVILSSVLSQFKDQASVLTQARKLLKPAGRLVIFEWHQKGMLLGPPPRARIAKEDVINLMFEQEGWKLMSDMDAGFYHYCLVFSKKKAPVRTPAQRRQKAAKRA